jgi:flotillin
VAAAQAEAARVREIGEAQAAADQQKGLAQARVTAAQGAALRANQAAVLQERLVAQLAEIVGAAGTSLNGANITVLNGADGINSIIANLVGNAITMFPDLQEKLGFLTPSETTDDTKNPETERLAQQAADDLQVPATVTAGPSIAANATPDGRVER